MKIQHNHDKKYSPRIADGKQVDTIESVYYVIFIIKMIHRIYTKEINTMNRKVKLLMLLIVFLFSFILPNICFGFSAIVSFGDSLSDTGNVYNATSGLQPAFPEYFNGRYSNGPVWVEYLADKYSADLFNYAYGGATTSGYGLKGVPGLDLQVSLFDSSGFSNYDDVLFTVWAGPNDFFQGSVDFVTSVDNIIAAIQVLQDDFGALHILVPNMPDLGMTPGALLEDPAVRAGLTALTNGFNFYLHEELAKLTLATIYEMDTQQILYDMAGTFGNATEGCYLVNGFSAWGFAGDYLFWDEVHPTTAAHIVLADFAAASVPVPGAFLLFSSGLVFLFAINRKTR